MLAPVPLCDSMKEAEAWGLTEWRRLAPYRSLDFKARTCSARCYSTLPEWRQLAFRLFPFLAARFR